MTRQEITQRSTTYSRAVARIGWPCLIVSISASVVWMVVSSSREDVNLMFLAVIAAPVAVCLIALSRLQKRLALACPHCHRLLFKPKIQQLVFKTGTCPNCKVRILDNDAG